MCSYHVFRKQTENEIDVNDLLRKVNICKPEELEDLLIHVENKIDNSDYNNRDLLLAKTMITSRLASIRSN